MSIPRQKEWDEHAAKLEVGMVDSIRASAEKWGASISTLTALVGASTVFGSGEAIAKLDDSVRFWVWAGFAFASVSAAAAVVLAAFAAQGVPGLQAFDTTSVYNASLASSEKAAIRLNWSRWLVIPALLGFGVAATALTFGATKNTPDALYIAYFANSDAICGTLTPMTGTTGEVGLKVNDKPQSIKGAVSLMVVTECAK